jgi:hypothetical protein
VVTERRNLELYQSSWLEVQVRFQALPDFFLEVVSLERGRLSLVSTIQELLERKNSGSGLEIRENGRRDLSCWPLGTLYRQTLALASPTSGDCTVSRVRSGTQAGHGVFYDATVYSIICLLVLINNKLKAIMNVLAQEDFYSLLRCEANCRLPFI